MKTNTKGSGSAERLRSGGIAAAQSDEMQLRRAVMTCLLWEKAAYESGSEIIANIQALVPRVAPQIVSQIAMAARHMQKLRHVPLLLCREMLRYDTHRPFVAATLENVILRADEMGEFLSIYWKTGGKPKSVPKQAKLGLAKAFQKFDEYQLAKWDRGNASVRLRDVMFLVHPKPKDATGEGRELTRTYKDKNEGSLLRHDETLQAKLTNNALATPDTWEVGLSAAKSPEEKKAVWERLLVERKLPAFALLKNLRNMQQVGVAENIIRDGIKGLKGDMLLPIDFLKAYQYAPGYKAELEEAMLKCAAQWPKLPGHTIMVIDVSGSMGCGLSDKSQYTRVDAAAAMAVLAKEMCESCTLYVTADRHVAVPSHLKGFALTDVIKPGALGAGGGGIYTYRLCEFLREQHKSNQPDRIVVFSDSQDCGGRDGTPRPHGKKNYIVDVSPHKNGVNYEGIWTAEIAGWSDQFMRYIALFEASTEQQQAFVAAVNEDKGPAKPKTPTA